jgi:hypothetical protein
MPAILVALYETKKYLFAAWWFIDDYSAFNFNAGGV